MVVLYRMVAARRDAVTAARIVAFLSLGPAGLFSGVAMLTRGRVLLRWVLLVVSMVPLVRLTASFALFSWAG